MTQPPHGHWQPTEAQQPPAAARARRKGLIIAAIVAAAVVVAGGATALALSLTAGEGDTAPEPISRAELLERYAEMRPFDRGTDPATVDRSAAELCSFLDGGMTTDDLITAATPGYGPQATEVVRLFVSYGCPKYLASFK